MATQKLLKPDEAILLVVPTDYGIQIMAVTSEGAKWVRAPSDTKQVSDAVRRLLWDAGAAGGSLTSLPFGKLVTEPPRSGYA